MFLGRLLTSIAVSLAITSSAVAVPSVLTPSVAATRELSLHPVGRALNPLAVSIATSRHARRSMTNAERLAKGLPPNAPRRRAPGQLRARASPTPTVASDTPTSAPSSSSTSSSAASDSSSSSAPSSASSTASTPPATPTCFTTRGRIATHYKDGDGFDQSGWLAAAANSFGEYMFTTDGNQALILDYQTCEDDASNTGAPVTLTSENGLASYPYLAAISGFTNTNDDISSGSFNYAYIGGSATAVPVGPAHYESNGFSDASSIMKDVETAIWSIGYRGVITPMWVNTDGSMANAQVVYLPSGNLFALTGDLDVFVDNFGTAYPTDFTFITGFQK